MRLPSSSSARTRPLAPLAMRSARASSPSPRVSSTRPNTTAWCRSRISSARCRPARRFSVPDSAWLMSTRDESLRISSRVDAGSPWDGVEGIGAVRMPDTKRSRSIIPATRLLVNQRAGDGRVARGAWRRPKGGGVGRSREGRGGYGGNGQRRDEGARRRHGEAEERRTNRDRWLTSSLGCSWNEAERGRSPRSSVVLRPPLLL